MSVIVNIITVAPGEHQGVWNQWQFNCWLNSLFRFTIEKYQRFVLLFMYGEQNNTRLCKEAMVVMFDTVLCGANTFEHGRHIWCNGTRQYQPKGNYYLRHAEYLVSLSHDGVMTSKRFPYCWPFVGRIHCSPVYFPHKGPWMRSFEVSFVDSLKIHENSYLPESHEDVIKWWIFPHKGQWRGAWMSSLICALTNG